MKLVQGFGVNDAPYSVDVKGELPRINGKRKRYQIFLCPFYVVWKEMIRRCYSGKLPSYSNVTVCDDWKSFMKFRDWMISQDYEDKHLDKDIIGDGTLYSPDNCRFVTQRVNKFVLGFTETCSVYFNEYSFVAKGKDWNGKSIHLGSFSSWESARRAYISHKRSQIIQLREDNEICDEIMNALLDRYKGA